MSSSTPTSIFKRTRHGTTRSSVFHVSDGPINALSADSVARHSKVISFWQKVPAYSHVRTVLPRKDCEYYDIDSLGYNTRKLGQ